MIGLLQRVSEASVTVEGQEIASIGKGLMVLACAERGDTTETAARLAERLIAYRVFADIHGRMNLSLADIGGELLLVPQFTLAANTHKGLRPSFVQASPPGAAKFLFDSLTDAANQRYEKVVTGRFGARMSVALVNEGPVTFWLRVSPHVQE